MKQNIFSKKNQLDEMQEQTLRKIESRGFWLMCSSVSSGAFSSSWWRFLYSEIAACISVKVNTTVITLVTPATARLWVANIMTTAESTPPTRLPTMLVLRLALMWRSQMPLRRHSSSV